MSRPRRVRPTADGRRPDSATHLTAGAESAGFTRAGTDSPEVPRRRPGGSVAVRERDRKSTRLNSSHLVISYAVFCLKKKKKITEEQYRLNEEEHHQCCTDM